MTQGNCPIDGKECDCIVPCKMPVPDYEHIAFDYLVKLHMGDEALVRGWRSNADLRWMLTLQLCKSLAEGKRPHYSTAGTR